MGYLLRRAANREWNQLGERQSESEREKERDGGGGGKYQSYDVALSKVIGLPFCFGTEMSILCHRRFEVCNLSFGFIRVAVKRLP